MDEARRPYRRESEASRRDALIAATQSLVAEGGPEAATVRAIAARAGVTAGLIRHYFGSKDELSKAAYVSLMDGMTDKGSDATEGVGAEPEARLAAFLAASIRPPVAEVGAVVLWAGFMHKIRNDAEMMTVHEAGYLRYRNALQLLIAALPRSANTARQRADAIACNALIDGLWLESSLLPGSFSKGEIVRIGLSAAGAILGIDLITHAGHVLDPEKVTP